MSCGTQKLPNDMVTFLLGGSMRSLIDIQRKIVPEALMLLEKRYAILKEICLSKSIGRRLLAQRMDLSERIIRSEVDFLKEEGLVEINPSGMEITAAGLEILDLLGDHISEIRGLSEIENRLRVALGIKDIVIVPTSTDSDPNALKELGRAASRYFLKLVKPDSIVGITGGYTMYEFSEQMPRKDYSDMMIVPARGGLGEVLEIQSNTIVAHLASRLNANYKLLQIPDSINKDIMERIYNDPQIKSVYHFIERIDCLVFGIGNAHDMSLRRNIKQEQWDVIKRAGAVAESFGHYFNIDGEIVFETGTVGIRPDQYKRMNRIIGVAGGEGKADAILAISKINKNLVLITDESAAFSILNRLQ